MRFGTDAKWPPSLATFVVAAQALLDQPSGTVVRLQSGTTYTPIEVENAAGDARWIIRRRRPSDPRPKNVPPVRAIGELALLLRSGNGPTD